MSDTDRGIKMKILVVGGGGREHAIIHKLSQSSRVSKLYCAPGNGGISGIAECISYKAMDIDGIAGFASSNAIDLVFVAPDDPLAAGMVDALEKKGIRAFGARKNAALLEASKIYSKGLMNKYGIPTAAYGKFDSPEKAATFAKELGFPVVIKADGLALGKGVIIALDKEQADAAIKAMLLDGVFGSAGSSIIVEEFLHGPELTVLAFVDGKTIIPMVDSRDHKRALDGDMGLNTGGMGAISPSRLYDDKMADRCMKEIFMPTLNALNSEGVIFQGVLYFGLLLTEKGPKILEYNARFGDPEAQAVLVRLKSDFVDAVDAVIDQKLDSIKLEWDSRPSACVVMSSGGYPQSYRTGFEITGLGDASAMNDVIVFHAGTRVENGRFYTSGGRVLGITALGDTLDEAIERAYKAVELIDFEGKHYRTDIGKKH